MGLRMAAMGYEELIPVMRVIPIQEGPQTPRTTASTNPGTHPRYHPKSGTACRPYQLS